MHHKREKCIALEIYKTKQKRTDTDKVGGKRYIRAISKDILKSIRIGYR